VALALAALGAVVLARRERAFLAFALLALVAPPVLETLVARGGEAPDLSPRHVAYALPLWAALVGVGAARIAERGLAARVAALGAAGLVVLLGPQTIADPRGLTYIAPLGSHRLVAQPAQWLRERVGSGDLLFPYSAVFLAALPEAGHAHGLPRAEPQPLLDTLRRARFPAGDVFVAIPSGPAHLSPQLGRRYDVAPFEAWLLVRARGPFPDAGSALRAVRAVLVAARPRSGPPQLLGWLGLERSVVERALAAS